MVLLAVILAVPLLLLAVGAAATPAGLPDEVTALDGAAVVLEIVVLVVVISLDEVDIREWGG